MKERPILFSTPMVQALLEDRKTQTRRIIKPQHGVESIVDREAFCSVSPYPLSKEDCGGYAYIKTTSNRIVGLPCPYGKAGDRLWVRETFKVTDGYAGYESGHTDDFSLGYADVKYLAGGKILVNDLDDKQGEQAERYAKKPNFSPSIFMPRWACRIELEITNIRVERLQDISEEDAKTEGCDVACTLCGSTMHSDDSRWFGSKEAEYHWACDAEEEDYSYKKGYANLWNLINGKGAWAKNPWVWVVEFKVLKKENKND